MKYMFSLALYGIWSNEIIEVSKKYYSSYEEAKKEAIKRRKLTGLKWIVKPVKLL